MKRSARSCRVPRNPKNSTISWRFAVVCEGCCAGSGSDPAAASTAHVAISFRTCSPLSLCEDAAVRLPEERLGCLGADLHVEVASRACRDDFLDRAARPRVILEPLVDRQPDLP